jgi:hypothetical protein
MRSLLPGHKPLDENESGKRRATLAANDQVVK